MRLLILTVLGLASSHALAQAPTPQPGPVAPARPVAPPNGVLIGPTRQAQIIAPPYVPPPASAPVVEAQPAPAQAQPVPATAQPSPIPAQPDPAQLPPAPVQAQPVPAQAQPYPVPDQPRAIHPRSRGQTRLPPPVLYSPPRARYRLPPPRVFGIEPRRHGNANAPFALGVGGSLLWRDDRAQHLLSDHNRIGAFELFATYDVWTPARSLVVAAGASLRSEAKLGSEDYDLHDNTVQAELQTRFGVSRWLWPHIRLGVGGTVTRFTAHDRVADITYRDQSGTVVGTFGAGFTLRTPARAFETHRGRLASLSLGLLVEGGYSVAKAADIDLKPTHSGDVARTSFSLGSIDRSAPYLRLMGVIRL